MVVYLDLLFVVNFVIDSVLLLATAWTMKTKPNVWRLAASAAMGAGYVLFLFLPGLSFLFTFGVKIVLSLLMIVTTFGFGSLQRFLRLLCAFYVVNFAVAGGMFGLYYLFLSSSELAGGMFRLRSAGIPPAGLMAAALPALVWLYMRVFQSGKRQAEMLVYLAEVQVKIGDFLYCCSGLVDTGNRLYDPLTKTPVMIVEAGQWKDVLPEEWLKQIRQAEVEQIVMAIGQQPFVWQDRLRLVPFRGVNRTTQFMLAIKPDRVTVHYNNKHVETRKVLVGFDGGNLSADGSYHAIIHPGLLEA